MIRIGINGFGRIGRSVLRQALHDKRVKVVGINDLTDPKTLAHLLKYDSTHGVLNDSISIEGSDIVINSESIKIFSEPQPREIPWESLNVDVVLECTGRFTKKEDAFSHVIAGAKKSSYISPIS